MYDDPRATPVDCLDATLFELAGSRLHDRAATLAHGLEALRGLQRRLAYAESDSVENLRHRADVLEDQLEVARSAARTLLNGGDPGWAAAEDELAWLWPDPDSDQPGDGG
jgi:hypothetical protein